MLGEEIGISNMNGFGEWVISIHRLKVTFGVVGGEVSWKKQRRIAILLPNRDTEVWENGENHAEYASGVEKLSILPGKTDENPIARRVQIRLITIYLGMKATTCRDYCFPW